MHPARLVRIPYTINFKESENVVKNKAEEQHTKKKRARKKIKQDEDMPSFDLQLSLTQEIHETNDNGKEAE